MDATAYQPLNLYTNYQQAAQNYPTTPILLDEVFIKSVTKSL